MVGKYLGGARHNCFKLLRFVWGINVYEKKKIAGVFLRFRLLFQAKEFVRFLQIVRLRSWSISVPCIGHAAGIGEERQENCDTLLEGVTAIQS